MLRGINMDEKKMRSEVDEIVELVLKDYDQGRDIDNMDVFNLPDREEVIEIVVKLLQVLFPGYYRDKGYKFYNMYSKLNLQLDLVRNRDRAAMVITFIMLLLLNWTCFGMPSISKKL